MTNPIIDRIHKLLNMTAENGCTEDEAETALRMAAGLMAKHGIEQNQLSKVEVKNLAKIGRRISQEFKRYQILLADAAASLYGCTCLRYSNGKYGIEFVGRPDNIEAAEETMFWLLSQVEYFYKQNLPRGLTVSARANYRRTFKEACAHRVLHRANQLMIDMSRTDAAARESTGSTALVVQDYFKKLREEVDEAIKTNIPNLRIARTMRFTGGSGTADGLSAGDRVKLRKEVQ